MAEFDSADWGRASLAQHGMWITERAGAGGIVHHMPLAVWLEGPLDVDRLTAACAAVTRRHPVLTAKLVERRGELRLAAGPTPAVEVAQAREDWLEHEVNRGFDLEAGNLTRFTLARLEPKRHVLLIMAHHAVFDGVSKDIVVRDLATAYNGSALPAPVPYAEAVAAEHERAAAKLEDAARFWGPRWHDERKLALPGLLDPRIHAAPAQAVDVTLGDGLGTIAEALAVTRFEALLAALHLLLYAYGNERPAVLVPVSTRTRETRDLVGPFVNEVPVISRPAGTFAELARWIRGELRAMYDYREVPLARALGGVSPRSALTPITLSYRRRTEPDPVFSGLTARIEWMMFNGWVRNTLLLQVVDGVDGVCAARLAHNPEALTRDGCLTIAEDLSRLLSALAERPGASLAELPLPERVPLVTAGDGRAAHDGAAARDGAAIDDGLTDKMCAIWREVLEVDEVDPGDDLFDLGGHSLSIAKIVDRVREEMGVEVSFEVFIDDPTPASVAAEAAVLLRGKA